MSIFLSSLDRFQEGLDSIWVLPAVNSEKNNLKLYIQCSLKMATTSDDIVIVKLNNKSVGSLSSDRNTSTSVGYASKIDGTNGNILFMRQSNYPFIVDSKITKWSFKFYNYADTQFAYSAIDDIQIIMHYELF